jgi:hypothetical protein
MQASLATQDTPSSALFDVPVGLGMLDSDQPDPFQAADTGDSTSDPFVREPTATHAAADVQDTPASPAPSADVCPGPARAIQTPVAVTATSAATATIRSTRELTA